MECFTCQFAQDLTTFTNDFAIRGSTIFYDGIYPVAKSILTLVVVVMGLRLVIDRGYVSQAASSFPKLMLITAVVVVTFASPMFIFEFLLWPMQNFAVAFAEAMMQEFSPASSQHPPKEYTLYTRLVWQVEYMVQWVIVLATKIITGAPWYNLEIFERFFGALLLLAPWLFIVILQAAFMIEAAFMFAIAGIMAPLLLAVYVAPPGRVYLHAMGRILLGAMLTVMLASVVISFTGFAIQTHQATVRSVLDPSTDETHERVAEAQQKADELCAIAPDINPLFTDGTFDPSKNWFDQWNEAREKGNDAQKRCLDAREQVAILAAPAFSLFDSYYMQLIAIGFISVLLHLKAKTWASNLAGAQDGPGAAAGVASVITGAAGVGLAMSKNVFGQSVRGGTNLTRNIGGEIGSRLDDSGTGGDPLRGGPVNPVVPPPINSDVSGRAPFSDMEMGPMPKKGSAGTDAWASDSSKPKGRE
ncbi:hypothetical protein [Magnetovibrio sp.]|uniref:hypothetical protein n=1 Tax=Magnetovibrio sp. TaxID=2024836 RepID=UPI002F94D2F1